MQITPYPEFETVFENDTLKGIFYPLCKISNFGLAGEKSLFFVSHNGIWTDENVKNDYNRSNFICFDLKNGKYSFKGDLTVYLGHRHAREVFNTLETDFEKHGNDYLSQQLKTDDYSANIVEKYEIQFGDLDPEYYLQTFYEFAINKLSFEKTGNFGAFNEIINDWGKTDKSPIVYEVKDGNTSGFENIMANRDYLFPESLKIDAYEKIGYIVGHEFFTDGNDTYLLFDDMGNTILCVDHYS